MDGRGAIKIVHLLLSNLWYLSSMKIKEGQYSRGQLVKVCSFC